MRIKFVFLFLLMSIFFSISATAQPPFIESPIFDQGLTIKSTPFEGHQLNTNLTFFIHAYNTSNGVIMDNTTTSCFIDLYLLSSGEHIIEGAEATYSGHDFKVFLNSANFTNKGFYSYVANCNTSRSGGFLLETFQVTNNGDLADISTALFQFGLIFILIIFLLVIMWAHMGDKSIIARYWWFSFMWIIVLVIAYLAWQIAENYLQVSGMLADIFYLAWFVIMVIYPFYLLGLTVYTFFYIYKQKEVQSLINRGFTSEDAHRRARW